MLHIKNLSMKGNNMNSKERNALEMARHELTTLHGLDSGGWCSTKRDVEHRRECNNFSH